MHLCYCPLPAHLVCQIWAHPCIVLFVCFYRVICALVMEKVMENMDMYSKGILNVLFLGLEKPWKFEQILESHGSYYIQVMLSSKIFHLILNNYIPYS